MAIGGGFRRLAAKGADLPGIRAFFAVIEEVVSAGEDILASAPKAVSGGPATDATVRVSPACVHRSGTPAAAWVAGGIRPAAVPGA
jgi:hypothetical protein